MRVRNTEAALDSENDCSETVHDYWLLEIWDNFSGFCKAAEADSYLRLARSFGQDVIDANGQTRPSGHGLVEIKEAMRFLHDHANSPMKDRSGRPIPWACEPHRGNQDCCHANVANVFDEAYDGVKNELGTLVYRVRLQRPRLLGVWVPMLRFDENACSSVSKGVFFRKELSHAGIGEPSLAELCPHLLVIRDPGEGSVEGMVKKLAEQHWRLPFRLFVVTNDPEHPEKKPENMRDSRLRKWKAAIKWLERRVPRAPRRGDLAPFLPRNRVRILHAPKLWAKLNNPNPDLLNLAFVNQVYDHWLMAYKPLPDGDFGETKKWHLAVCFDRDERTVKHLWRAAGILFKVDSGKQLKSLSVSSFYYQRGGEGADGLTMREGSKLAAGFPLDESGDSQERAGRLILFGNHGKKPPGGCIHDAIQHKSVAFSQEFGSEEAPAYVQPALQSAIRLGWFSFFSR